MDISSLLPEITPNYRPVGLPIDQPRRFISEDEALSRVMTNKNLRYLSKLVLTNNNMLLFKSCDKNMLC